MDKINLMKKAGDTTISVDAELDDNNALCITTEEKHGFLNNPSCGRVVLDSEEVMELYKMLKDKFESGG